MVTIGVEEFENLVGEALDSIPRELLALLDNLVILVEAEPAADDPDLLGLYEGVPLTDRYQGWGLGDLPDRITVYRGPLQRMCDDRDELREEVAVTVVHEIAHHFGLDDEALHELGWA